MMTKLEKHIKENGKKKKHSMAKLLHIGLHGNATKHQIALKGSLFL